MDGRFGGSYRYDFNGKETDPESNLQDYGMRIYNARLGKFLSVDPITSKYPELTPYQFASNTPIQAIDLDGMEAAKPGSLASAGSIVSTTAGLSALLAAQRTALDKADAAQCEYEAYLAEMQKARAAKEAAKNAPPKPRTPCGVCTGGYLEPEPAPADNTVSNISPVAGYDKNRSIIGSTSSFQIRMNQVYTNQFLFEQQEEANEKLDPLAHYVSHDPFVQVAITTVFAPEETPELVIGRVITYSFPYLEEGPTIGLGIHRDLSYFGSDATTYLNAGWQKAGLTRADWGRALYDNYYFLGSFQDAASRAARIRFNVTNFDPFYPNPGVTNSEFNTIIGKASYEQKTIFFQNGQAVYWNGERFIRY